LLRSRRAVDAARSRGIRPTARGPQARRSGRAIPDRDRRPGRASRRGSDRRGRCARATVRAGCRAGPHRRAPVLRRPDRGRDRGGARNLAEHGAPEVAAGEGVPPSGAPVESQMTPERWATVQELFATASGLGAGEREAFLDGACGQDAELRREVDSLLASLRSAESGFLESPAIDALPSLSPGRASEARPLARGVRLGPYEILSPLGAG